MQTTALKFTVRLTKEELKQLNKLSKQLGESKSQIARRALSDLYSKTFHVEHK